MEESDNAHYLEAWREVEDATKECERHGTYESSLMAHRHPRIQAFWTKCPDCNTEIEEEEAQLRERYDTCSADDPHVEHRLHDLMLAAAGVPPRYRSAHLQEWRDDHEGMEGVGQKLKAYVEGFDIALERGKNMIFVGNPGTGKTYAACAIVNEIILKRDHTARYVTANDFLTRLRNTYSADAEEREIDVLADYIGPSLLVIDEVGRHKDSQHATDSLFALLDRRYREVRPTILISNMSKDDIVSYLGDALVSRLRQDGQMLGFYWEDQRK
jgi:DNA replication protein DnaC